MLTVYFCDYKSIYLFDPDKFSTFYNYSYLRELGLDESLLLRYVSRTSSN